MTGRGRGAATALGTGWLGKAEADVGWRLRRLASQVGRYASQRVILKPDVRCHLMVARSRRSCSFLGLTTRTNTGHSLVSAATGKVMSKSDSR